MNTISPEMQSLKARLKATWMAGDFGVIAKMTEGGADEFIARLGIAPGARVLDVACGSGNLAIPAARRGAHVTGVDIATNLLEEARARAASERLAIQFDEGDAEQLPYAEHSFDVVVSMFGVMFAPRPDVAADELVRVARSGGRIALANWTPGSFAGQMFKTVGRHVPPPPGMPPPVQWGEEPVVRQRLRDGIAGLEMNRRIFPIRFPFAPPQVVELFRAYFGPVNRAFAALDGAGQADLHQALLQLLESCDAGGGRGLVVPGDYLEVVVTKS